MKSHSYFAANIKRSSACTGPLVPLSDMVRTFHVATTSSFERAAALADERTTRACALTARRAGRPLLLGFRLSKSLCSWCLAQIHLFLAFLCFLSLSSLPWFLPCCSFTGISGLRARRPPPSRPLCLHARCCLLLELRQQCFNRLIARLFFCSHF